MLADFDSVWWTRIATMQHCTKLHRGLIIEIPT